MLAAIYARKSTEQTGISDDQKSVTRQVEHAKDYAKRKGWCVSEAHIYSDDGISGAEFVKRPAFIRLMSALKPKPPFQILIMSEESRLGREQIKTAYALQQLTDAGVQVWYYLTDEERKLDTAMEKIMGSLTGFASEVEREKAQQRTYDAMKRKAKAGHVTGGSVFGYDNVEIVGPMLDAAGCAKRSHVELRINQTEAEVVRKIFRLYTEGHGFTSIAKALNAEGAHCPRPRPSLTKPHGWVGSSVREIILRRRYVGEQVWGRTKSRMPSGVKKSQRRPEHEWIVVSVPQLQIISPELWKEAQGRWKSVRKLYLRATDGRLHGRPTNGHESPYLLTGFTECKKCKGSLFIKSRSHGKRRAFHYACTTHYQRGPASCSEPMLLPMELLDHAILETIEQDVLQPAILVKAVEKALQQLTTHDDESDARREGLRKDLVHVEAELARLAMAIATGGSMTTLVSAVQDREERRTRLHAELASLDGAPFAQFDAITMEQELRSYLADWPALAQRHYTQTRQILRKLLPNRIRVWGNVVGEEKHYHFQGEAAMGRFVSGLVEVKRFGVPNGTQQSTERPLSIAIDLLVVAA